MSKKVLFFDCFGVIAPRVLGAWVKDNLGKDFKSQEIFDEIDIGKVSEEEALHFFSKLVDRDPQVVRKEIDSYFSVNQPLAEYIHKLRTKGYKVVLLSNSNATFLDRYVFERHPEFKEIFDDIIISAKIGMIKPNRDIFEYALKKFSITPDETLFIDDNEKYIKGTQAVGIESILFTSTDALKVEFTNRGI